MDIDQIRKTFQDRYPQWNAYFDQSGISVWVSLNDGDTRYYEIQITPHEGIGVTNRANLLELDFGGHDAAFESLEEALDYIEGESKHG